MTFKVLVKFRTFKLIENSLAQCRRPKRRAASWLARPLHYR